MRVQAEYIWIDGATPTKELRSKTKILPNSISGKVFRLSDFPEWGFDGSSTGQAEGHDSDCVLRPVAFVRDPIRRGENILYNVGGIRYENDMPNFLVMCEVFLPDGVTPHPTNTRSKLREVLDAGARATEPWFGIEQEYALFGVDGGEDLYVDSRGVPTQQGPFYCSVGVGACYGRELIERHTQACIDAGILIEGTNFEVAPAQAEFQIGTGTPLDVSDHLWLARWLLYRIGEDFGVAVSLEAKPFGPDFNGSGAHTNFSTAAMRCVPGQETSKGPVGMEAITEACVKLGERVREHIAVYGDGIEERLTGLHETCSHKEFRFGVADRGASIRIPRHVGNKGYGYLEDRRPNANMDPYEVTARILKTVCDL